MNSDDHFDRSFAFMAMKGNNKTQKEKNNNESTDSLQKNINAVSL
jgi:hypothetical protein